MRRPAITLVAPGILPLVPGSVIRCRPVGVLLMEDESGADEKLLAVPDVKTTPYYEGIGEGEDLPKIVFDQIAHFFTHFSAI